MEVVRIAEQNIIREQGMQAVTKAAIEREMWKMNYLKKTLNDLTGGDNKIIIILDDRDDVWRNDNGSPSENLLQIPAYYYWKENHQMYKQQKFFEKMIRECLQNFDLDLTLLIYAKHLEKLHV